MKGNFLKSSVPNYDVSLGSNQQILESNDATVVIFNSDFRVDGYNFAYVFSYILLSIRVKIHLNYGDD